MRTLRKCRRVGAAVTSTVLTYSFVRRGVNEHNIQSLILNLDIKNMLRHSEKIWTKFLTTLNNFCKNSVTANN